MGRGGTGAGISDRGVIQSNSSSALIFSYTCMYVVTE